MTVVLSVLAAAPAPAPAWGTVLTTWRTTWAAEVAVTAIAALYLRTALRVGGWPVARTVAFVAALAVAIVTVDSGITTYAPRSYSVHAVMILLLAIVVPALWVAGRPLELLARGGSERAATRLDRVRGSLVVRTLTAAPTVLLVYTAVVVSTGLADIPEVLDEPIALAAGMLFFHTALGLDRRPERPSFGLRLLLVLGAAGVGTVVGTLLMSAPATLLPAFRVEDVHLGGAITLTIGGALLTVIMVSLGWRWVTSRSMRLDADPWSGERGPGGPGSGPLDSGTLGPGTPGPGTLGPDGPGGSARLPREDRPT